MGREREEKKKGATNTDWTQKRRTKARRHFKCQRRSYRDIADSKKKSGIWHSSSLCQWLGIIMAGGVSFYGKGCQPPDKWWQDLKNNESHSWPLQAERWLLNGPMYCSIKHSTGLQLKTHRSMREYKTMGIGNIFIAVSQWRLTLLSLF